MRIVVFDIETTGLLDKKDLSMHCFYYNIVDTENIENILEEGVLTKKEEVVSFCSRNNTSVFAGHNIICYDFPVLKRLFGVDVPYTSCFDTLPLSYTLYPLRAKHGLESWGETLKIKKPEIKDWNDLTIEEYIHRCKEDVKINLALFKKQWSYLHILYEYCTDSVMRYVNYLGFKMSCIRDQEEVKCKVDIVKIREDLDLLKKLKEEKVGILKAAMPANITHKTVKRPKTLYKKDGSYSLAGKKWVETTSNLGLPLEEDFITVVGKISEANPDSPTQVKNWLDILGWEPCTYEERKNTLGEIKEVPQIYVNSEVTPSVKSLIEVCPEVSHLDMYSLIKHRIGVLQSFIDSEKNGFVVSSARGLTNTLRLKHSKPIANMPSVKKYFGENIRGAIIAREESSVLCGTDMSALEDTTKQHYMFFFDPEYVTQMRVPGFDPHIDIAVLAGMMSKEDAEKFNALKEKEDLTEEEKKIFTALNIIRSSAKTVNFAGVYGAGAPKIAKTLNKPLEFAEALHKTYWSRNKSVKQVAESMKIKLIFHDMSQKTFLAKDLIRMNRDAQEDILKKVSQMWVKNPVSGFWYSLRYLKDIFSTTNQSTGVYCFDSFVREVKSFGVPILLQYHDRFCRE